MWLDLRMPTQKAFVLAVMWPRMPTEEDIIPGLFAIVVFVVLLGVLATFLWLLHLLAPAIQWAMRPFEGAIAASFPFQTLVVVLLAFIAFLLLAFVQVEMRTLRTPTHGYEPMHEAAMAAFAKSWRRE
jgi:hypothetical protein